MPALAPPSSNEKDLLVAYLIQQQDAFRNAAYGLTDEQAGQKTGRSALTVGSLVKHSANAQKVWRLLIEAAPEVADMHGSSDDAQKDWESEHQWLPGDTLAAALAAFDTEAAATNAAILAADLDTDVPVPQDAPWFPKDIKAWSVRWVVLHLIEELARHAGHADIIRESVDGATMYELLAGREGWPVTPWLTPWTPPTA